MKLHLLGMLLYDGGLGGQGSQHRKGRTADLSLGVPSNSSTTCTRAIYVYTAAPAAW